MQEALRVTYQRGTVTRADIIEASGLNPASVSHTVRFLLDRGILVKVGDLDSNGGRRREALSLRGEAGYFVAVDLEGQTMRFALTNLVGDIRHRWEDELEFGRPLPAAKIVENVNRVLANLTPQQADRVLAVCVNYPGLLDDKGNITAFNIGWQSFPLRQALESVLSYPVILEHDKLCSVLAEHSLGCAAMEDNTLFLIVERGIGMGMFVDGKPIRGSHDRTGEIGHAKVAPDSQVVCSCGQRGCLETVASSPSVVRQYTEEASGSGKKGVHQATEVFRRARAGDKAARMVVERAARSIGFALSHAVSLVNPGLIVLGGDLVTAEDLFVPLIWEELRRLTLPLMLEDLQIKTSSLGLDIRLKGAASLAFRHAIAEPDLLAKLCRPTAARPAPSSRRSENAESAELAK
ncbi:MAG: ROK family protein [Bryobacterales bacterium]|nr:ROK family protein [Bryobacterales bacterium]